MICCCLALFLSVGVCQGREVERPSPPANLSPLTPDWKERVYDSLLGRNKEKSSRSNRFFFLDPPVPCVRETSTKLIAFTRPKITREYGYGGIVLIMYRGLIGLSFSIRFYLIDSEAKLILLLSDAELYGQTIEPELFTAKHPEQGGQYRRMGFVVVTPKVRNPLIALEAKRFREMKKEEFDSWPPFR